MIKSSCLSKRRTCLAAGCGLLVIGASLNSTSPLCAAEIGSELAVPRHLTDGEEYTLPIDQLLDHGRRLFTANWTIQEGGGRPLTKGTGAPVADPSDPLIFPRNFNRLSAPDANSCAGCHNAPFGFPGGGGDIVANVFVLGQRFDFATFDGSETTPTKGNVDERGVPVALQTIANSRATLGMFGSGYIELLAREITADLQAIRDGIAPGGSAALNSKGISYGTLKRAANGAWDTSEVAGIPAKSLGSSGPGQPPSLVIRPFHQAGAVVSLREFSNNAFNHHHGIQSTERFGVGTDPDGDGFANEMTRADITAASLFQAAMPVPGRVIPNNREIEQAVLLGERRFEQIGCATCHTPSLPLRSALFTEPNPYNPAGNLRPGDADPLSIDLNDHHLPSPRLQAGHDGTVLVPAYTDLKLHNLTDGPGDPNVEPLDMQQPAGSPGFFAGNGKFITRKLWGSANEPPFFHHGQFTTLREAVLAHGGEGSSARAAFNALPAREQGSVIEFLKTLQVLPPGSKHLVVDERGEPKQWPPPPGHARLTPRPRTR